MLRTLIVMVGVLSPLTVGVQLGRADALETRMELAVLPDRSFEVAHGFQVELVVDSDLVPRPINACFDWDGNLYVTDSSGSNEPVQEQLKSKPHRVMKLVDQDRDGKFETATVFADQMMFPAGVLFHDGSIYVSAPPHIWKLTDHDHDGVCDEREIWFDAKTLTGCANDLHGPYLGRDGWIYWCKGAFAEQTHQLGNGRRMTSRAAHIFRRRVEGGDVDVMMTGGMDNPVDVVMTRGAEQFFTTTFLQHPADGQRDGILHVVNGGLYGKRHGVLDSHPQTSIDFLPVTTHLGPAAPSGLVCLESTRNGDDWSGNLLSACFNLHEVKRHQPRAKGSGFTTIDSTLLRSTDLDFHPTDVLEDADGSILVVDTGGWYKLCCPTSQLHKPDELGGIYRVSRRNVALLPSSRGLPLEWTSAAHRADLVARVSDPLPVVRARAIEQLGKRRYAVAAIRDALLASRDAAVRQDLLWAACQNPSPQARVLVRERLDDPSPRVRCVAMHAVGCWRDAKAIPQLLALMSDSDPAVRRRAAETISRVRLERPADHAKLLEVVTRQLENPHNDGPLQQAMTNALIHHGVSPGPLEVEPSNVARQMSLMLAKQQIAPKDLKWDVVRVALLHADEKLRATATVVFKQHPEWTALALDWIAEQHDEVTADPGLLTTLASELMSRDRMDVVEGRLVEWLSGGETQRLARMLLLHLDGEWPAAIQSGVAEHVEDKHLADLLVSTQERRTSATQPQLQGRLRKLVESEERNAAVRVAALSMLGRSRGANTSRSNADVSDKTARWLTNLVATSESMPERISAIQAIRGAQLSSSQLKGVLRILPELGMIELQEMLPVLRETKSSEIGKLALGALARSEAVVAIRPTALRDCFQSFDDAIKVQLEQQMDQLRKKRTAKLANLPGRLAALPEGDIRRGQIVFHGRKAACFTCHAMGYRGGNIGPDLSRIGRIRSRTELFEAIALPNASIVRSYECFSFEMEDGKTHQGVIRDESNEQVVIVGADRQEVSLSSDAVVARSMSPQSIMPAGLDELLTEQELADLLTFLEAAR